MFHITYNGETNRQHGLEVALRPSIPAPIIREELVTIPGRNGAVRVSDGTYDPIEIEIPMNYVSRDPDKMGECFRRAKAFLKGKGTLIMSDDTDVFYRVLTVSVTDHNRRATTGADIGVVFTCDPFTYLAEGAVPVALSSPLVNDYILAYPQYHIVGEGMATLTVNGNAITANVGQNLTIDTDLMMSYRADGTLQNHAVSGANYEDLYLLPGNNTITITNGFTLTITPNWRML